MVSSVAEAVAARHLTYLSQQRLAVLEDHAAIAANLGGDFLEAGVALGGSAILLSSLLPEGAKFHGYDVFGMIPPPSERDDVRSHERYSVIASGRSEGLGGETYYGYVDDLYDRVKRNFTEFGLSVDDERIHLHRGLFEDTLQPAGPIAFAHIDCDWYDPVRVCLARTWPHLLPGGFVIVDDYADYGGSRQATDEFLETHDEMELVGVPASAVLRRRP